MASAIIEPDLVSSVSLNVDSSMTGSFVLFHKLQVMLRAGFERSQAHFAFDNRIPYFIRRYIRTIPDSTNYVGSMDISMLKSY